MLSYRLKCREKSESKNPEVWKKKKNPKKTEEECFYENVQCVIVKN